MTAPLLGEVTLGRFRQMQEANMPSTADLIVFSFSRLDGGGTGKTAHVRATVPCRIAVTGSGLPFVAEQPTPDVSYTVTMPVGTDIVGVERLNVRGATAGISWSAQMVVFGLNEPRSYEASVRLIAKRAIDSVTAFPAIGTVVVEEA
jgi:hypothetical protein